VTRKLALSAIGLTELIHGIYRARTPEMRLRRESFLNELLPDLTMYPYTKETAMLAGKLEFARGDRLVHRTVAALKPGSWHLPAYHLFENRSTWLR